MTIVLYGNGGAGNHGCEAITRGTSELVNKELILSSNSPKEDCFYGLNEICSIYSATSKRISKWEFVKAYIDLKLFKNYAGMDVLPYISAIKHMRKKASLAFSIGGDNYCYSDQDFYAKLNSIYKKYGFKTVLWGCSIDQTLISKKIEKDLASYDLILARESLTYDYLKWINKKTYLVPDPAFYMKPQQCNINETFFSRDVIGINISPMIISHGRDRNIVLDNYCVLIKYILENTSFNIALIPHVVWHHNDDRSVLNEILNNFKDSDRLLLIDDHTAPELKYIISKCRFFIGARTHSSIAAYSTCVPALVVGYSIKARGIAKDIFGTDEHYVVPVQTITYANRLTEAYRWLENHEKEIRTHLESFIPEYKMRYDQVKYLIDEFIE